MHLPAARPQSALPTRGWRGFVAGCLAVLPACVLAADDGLLSPTLTLDPNPSPFFTAIGSATSQGVSVLKADQARSIFGVTGAGVKLGVISDSFNGSGSTPTVATQIAAGNLPGVGNPNGYTTGVTVVKDDSGTDEGRAMLEIVHDVAPGAQLYFHSAFNNTSNPGYTSFETAAPDQTIADAIDGLAAVAGMRIIVDDVGILTAPRFQDGAAAQAANAAYARGIGYFSAAGNSATNATRVTTNAGVNGTVNWGSDDLLLMRVSANSTGRVVLQWGEPYTSVSGSAATSNFVVAVTTPNGAASYGSVDNQWANEDPYEFFSFSNSGTTALDFAVRATRVSGTAPVLMQVSTFGPGISITDTDRTNAPTVYGQAAATGAVGVAASAWWSSPATVESFSSRGPTQILFDASGNPVNELRSTPLLTAPDGVTTTTSGFGSFYGTSAAAPHAAAVAALVMERLDQKGIAYSTQDVYQVLYDSAVDIGTTGFDSASGFGRIDALAAVSAGRIWDGNGSTVGVSGSGSWSQAKWTLEASGDKPTGKFIRGQQAVFGSGTAAPATYSVTVDGSYDVAGLRFTRDTVTLASGSGALRLTAPTVDVASGLTATIAASLTGTGGLVKTGAGTLQLTGSTGYTGGTTISAGSLVANGNLASSGPIAVGAGGTLAGAGTVGAVSIATNATIAPGNSPGTLTTGDVIFGAGGNYNWQMTGATGTAGLQWDFISASGSLTVAATAGNPFAINLWTLSGTGPDVSGPAASFNQLSNYSWKLGSFAGGITGFASNLFSIVTGSANGTAGFANAFLGTFSMTTVGNDLDLVYTAPTLSSYDYTGGTGAFSDGANWSLGAPPVGTPAVTFSGGGGTATNDVLSGVTGLTFGGSASGAYVVTGSGLAVGAGGVTNDSAFTQTIQSPLALTASGTVAANAGGLVLSGGVATGGFGLTVAGEADTTIAGLSGAGGLVKNGGGTLVLSGSNSFTGGVSIAAGRLAVGGGLALGGTANAVAVNGGTLDVGTSSLTMGALTGSTAGVITTATDAGTRTFTTVVAAGTATYAGAIRDNGAGRLGFAKSGGGTLVLSGSSGYTGGTVISGGTLAVGDAAALGGAGNALVLNAGTLDTGMVNPTIGSLSGTAGTVITTATNAGTRTLTTVVAAGTSTYGGSVRDAGIGKVALVKSGPGTLVLTGSSSFTGGVTLAGGTLRAGASLAVGGPTNALAVNAGTLDVGLFSLSVGALSGSAGGVITTASNAGTRTLTTNVGSGTSVFAGTIQNSGSGVLAVAKTGAGTLVLAGNNTYSGSTSLTGGTLQVGDGGTSGRLGAGAISNNGALVFNRSDDHGGPVANAISGTGSLTLVRGGLTLSGSSSFTGDTRATSGTLTLAHSRALGGSTLDLNAADSGIVILSGTGVQTYTLGGLKGSGNLDIGGNSLSVGGNNLSTTYSGGISGTGGLVKTGFGSLTLTGSNAYAGATTISGGTLQVGSGSTTGALGAGPVVNNGGLVFNRTDGYGGPFGNAIGGSGSLRLAAGTLTLTGSNGYAGATTISGGTLQVGAGGTGGRLGTGAVTNNAALVFNRSDDYGGPVSNAISGSGSLRLAAGALTLTGSVGTTGTMTITAGTLQVGSGGTTGRLGFGPIANNGALVFNRSDNYGGTVTSAISGSGSLTLAGGTLALAAVNSFSGDTRVAGGVLSLANTQALSRSTLDLHSADSGVVTLSAGTTAMTYTLGGLSGSRNLAIGGNTLSIGNNNASTTYAGAISGSGGLVKIGTGTFTMTGSNSYTGITSVSSGRLVTTALGLSGTVYNYASLEFVQTTDGTFRGLVSNNYMGWVESIKSGSGTLTLSGTVTNGSLTVSGGRLVTGAGNLPGVRLVANATVEFAQATNALFNGSLSGSGAFSKTGSGTLTLQSGTFAGTTTVAGGRLVAPAATLRGPIVNNAAFEFSQSLNGEYASVLSGSGTLTKSGSGTLTLSGSSLVTGLTTITAGMLATGGAERLADTSTVSISGGATLRLGGNETIGALLGSGSVNLQSYQLTIAGSGSSSYFGSIFGSGGLSKAGSGALTLGGTNGFLGATNLASGTLVLSSSTALSPYTTLSIAAGSTLVLNRDVRVFSYTNAGGTISGSGRLLTSATAATGGTLTSLADVSGTDSYSVGLLKTSTATLVVSGSTSFTGGVVVEQGTVKLDAGGSFAASNVVDVRNGATLDLNGQSQTVSALAGSGSVALGGGTLTVDAATSTTFAGAIGGGSLVKSGSSALNLTGSAAVSTASVTSGLMSVNGTLTGTVAVAPGGTLGGAGTIIGDVTVSGTHAPGNSPEISTIAGNLSYGEGATVVWEIAANTATQGPSGSRTFDQIMVSGNLAFSGSTALVLSFFDQDPNSSWASTVAWGDEFWGTNHSWTLWQVSGTTTGFTNLSLQSESWLDSNGDAFGTLLPGSSFSLAMSGNDVTLVYAVPEPATLALAAAGIAASGLMLRRRRRS